ncbi:MAG: biosynthetic-type acetolactate synthase large subunit [Bacteroidales bacterium]|nr:biosynthetic-type acetolactate synthase large subunit [Bacteroidales bacterium]
MNDSSKKITGSQALLDALVAEGVDTIFGYPGGAIMPVYDKLYDYSDRLHHILVRHEQGAIHAAQGYARTTGKPGVVLVTSGPGATNVITGITDAMMDSTPVVVIAGQVAASALGTDAFQETDLIGLTMAITKWNYQIRRPEDVEWAVSRAFYIASTGRPGPVVLDFTKNSQVGLTESAFKICTSIDSYTPEPSFADAKIDAAVRLIDSAEKPFVVFGQGVILGNAEKELAAFLDKGGIPAGSTLLGLSALPSDNPHFKGMIGMHGNVAPNVKTNECDVLIAVGMRFDDRVTGTVETYARQAKVIHIDIDAAEIGKIIPVEVGIRGNAKKVLEAIVRKMKPASHDQWEASFDEPYRIEYEKVIKPETDPGEGFINMGEVVRTVAEVSGGDATIITDVGQNQMIGARYSKYTRTRSLLTSGGLGTMGFGLPAAIGAKVADPGKQVCLFVGDGGLQMNIQEFGTIMQEHLGVKIVLMNNNWLGNVRQWQEMFFNERYSQTRMLNPDYEAIAGAYGIRSRIVEDRKDLEDAVRDMFSDDKPFLLEVRVIEEEMVMPMVPPGKGIDQIMLNRNEWYENGK